MIDETPNEAQPEKKKSLTTGNLKVPAPPAPTYGKPVTYITTNDLDGRGKLIRTRTPEEIKPGRKPTK